MDKVLEKFAELADKFGPQVVDAAKGAAITEAYSALALGNLQLIIGGILLAMALWLLGGLIHGWDEMTVIPIALLGIPGFVLIGFGVWAHMDPWIQTAIDHPELWIAKKILGL